MTTIANVNWIPNNWYEILYVDESKIVFQYLTINPNGQHLVKLCDGTNKYDRFEKPIKDIINFGSKSPCSK